MNLMLSDGCSTEIMPINEINWLERSNVLSVSVNGRLTLSDTRNNWTLSAPIQAGFYWVGQTDTTLVRMVKVFWKGERLFVNESGDRLSVLDPFYWQTWWMGPVSPPKSPRYQGER